MTKAALFLVLGLIGGGIVGFFAGMNISDEPPATYTPRHDDSGDRFSPAEPEEKIPPPPPPDGGYRTLREAVSAIPVPPAAQGKGRITGLVTDGAGDPVEDVTIRATRNADGSGFHREGNGPPEVQSLEARVRSYVRRQVRLDRSRVEAVTDREGRFVLVDLPEGTYRLQGWLEGWKVEPRSWESGYKARPGDEIDFKAERLASVLVTVLLPGGGTPQEADISCTTRRSNGTSTRTQKWTPKNPTLRLTPGSISLQASVKGRDEYQSKEVSVSLVAGEPAEDVVLQLEGAVGVKGRVVFPPGEKARYCNVYMLAYTGGEAPDPRDLVRSGKSEWISEHDEEFRFVDLKPGLHLLGVGRGHGNGVNLTVTVEVSNAMVVQDLVIPAARREDYVIVHVTAPDGSPLPGVQISAGRRTKSSSSSGGGQVIKEKGGSYWVMHHQRGEDDATAEDLRYVLYLNSGSYGNKSVEYLPEKDPELHVRFDEPAFLVVTLAGAAPDVEFSLSVQPKRSGGWSAPRSATNGIGADGTQKFGPMEPGVHSVSLSVTTDRHSSRAVATKEVDVISGENHVTIAAPTLHRLTVVVDGAKKGKRLTLRSEGTNPQWHSARTDDSGRAEFKVLPPGIYMLSVNGTRGQMEVVVPGPSVVTFTPREVNAARVSVTDPAGKLARWGFRNGDVIVSVGGTEFTDERTMQRAFMAAFGKKQVQIALYRGRSYLTLEIDGTELAPGALGGDWAPTSR